MSPDTVSCPWSREDKYCTVSITRTDQKGPSRASCLKEEVLSQRKAPTSLWEQGRDLNGGLGADMNMPLQRHHLPEALSNSASILGIIPCEESSSSHRVSLALNCSRPFCNVLHPPHSAFWRCMQLSLVSVSSGPNRVCGA